jgi:hypothetical protein
MDFRCLATGIDDVAINLAFPGWYEIYTRDIPSCDMLPYDRLRII